MGKLNFIIFLLLIVPSVAKGQSVSDYCHVYMVDKAVAERAQEKIPTGDDKEDEKLLAAGVTILGRFQPRIGEEELTTRTFKLPGTDQIVTASVFYTDEMMYSTKLKAYDSMLVGVAVSKKEMNEAFTAHNSAVAEITYSDHTDTIRVKTIVQAKKRTYLVGMECRIGREYDETISTQKK